MVIERDAWQQTTPEDGNPALDGVDPVLRGAHALAPFIRERSREGEALRTLPTDVVAAMADAGLFTLLLPSALGGAPVDPHTVVDVVEATSRADGSAGWSVMIGNSSSFLAWFDPDIARRVLATSRYPAVTSVFAPTGRATPCGPDLYRVSGRWAFNSGCCHCDWFLVAVVVDDEEQAAPAPDRSNVSFALLPAGDAEILETWEVAGLQGTGSHDVVVDGAVVPSTHLRDPFHDPVAHDDPHCALPFWTQCMVLMAGFPLGVARRALDELVDLAPAKILPSGDLLSHDPLVQVDLARATAALDAARSFVHHAVEEARVAARRHGRIPVDHRRQVTAATVHAMATGVQVVDVAFGHGGGSALYLSSALQRCLRDIRAGAQHVAFGPGTWKTVGRSLLDVPQVELML